MRHKQLASVVLGFVCLAGCGAPASPDSPSTTSLTTAQKREMILAGGTDLKASQVTEPWVNGAEALASTNDRKVMDALDAVAGVGKDAMGQPNQKASLLVGKLRALAKGRVDVPERGFPTVKTDLLDQFLELSKNGPPKTAEGRKKTTDLAQKLGAVQPLANGMQTHLSAIFMAYNDSKVFGELVTAYPLTAAVQLGNMERYGLIAADKSARRAEVKRVIEATRKARTQAATIMGLFAAYQATVAGALAPSALDTTVVAARQSLKDLPPVAEQEVDDVLALADKALAEAATHEEELRQLAEKTRRPPPPKPSASSLDGAGSAVGSVLGLLAAIGTGDVSGIVHNAAALVPKNSPLGSAVAGVEALARGDFKGALSAAAKIAPGTPVGIALAQADQLTKTVDGIVGKVQSAKDALRPN